MPGTELVTEEKTMAITIKPEILSKFTNAIAMKAKDVAFEVLQNYPEASSEWIRCTHYAEYNIPDCKSYTLKFRTLDGIHDDENFQSREANTDDVAQAVVTMFMLVVAGELHVGLDAGSFWEADEWDAIAIDCLMQIHFYGEVVYG